MTTPNFPVQGRWVYQNDPHLFDTLRKQSIGHLQTAFGRVLGRADDWLFDLAQKEGAVTGSPQIDAMRTLRMARASMERGFLQHFESGFDALHRKIVPAEQSSRILSLVEEDQLEAQLASEVVIEAITRAHGPALDAVEFRFAVMIGSHKLDPALNPLSAVSLANGVQVAQSEVSLPENLRVVLFKLYERELVQNLGTLLTEINARMSAAGILPELGNPRPVDAPAPAAPSQPHAQPQASAQQHAAQADDRAMFDALCGLLHSWRPHVGDTGGMNIPAGTGGMAGAGNRRPLAMPELVSVLSLMQNHVPKSVEAAMASPEASLSMLMKQEMMRSAGNIGLPSDAIKMAPDDEDAVDLVGMLFDVLFDERDFEAQARTLISRCVVPFVKAAVIDRRLFQYKTHPARRLLNSLAEAVEGNKGEGPQERELLGKAEETVDKLVAEFNEDIAIFETLEQELRSFLEQHRRRIELAERRATEAQRGQERLEQARTLAASELSRRTSNRNVPIALYDFLTRCWSHHLSMIALREGPDSAAWNSALGVADSLLDLVPQPGHAIHMAGPALNNLREPIEGVLASSGITGEAAQDMIRNLQTSLDDAAAALAHSATSPAAPAAATAATVQAPATAALAEAQPGLVMVADKDRLDYNAEDIPVLRALKIGAWVDMAGDDQKLHPAKLSWVSPISSRLMFVNRRGVRVLVASAEELASMKKLGKLVLREQEQVFDQAMHRVMGRLQNDVA
jgi:hypothetical protein